MTPVPEGTGNLSPQNVPAAANQAPRGNIQPDDGRLTAAAGVGIAIAVVAVIVCALFTVRRQRRSMDPTTLESMKPIHTMDEDDQDDDVDATVPVSSRKAHILGEEDSLLSGEGGSTIRSRSLAVGDADDDRHRSSSADVHKCSSATCEICERNRQSGVNFIPSSTVLLPPSRQVGMPRDATRGYVADDTVML